MADPCPPVERRKSPRARLRLPVRIRWMGPLGMRLEITETVDASREGLLIRRAEPCNPWAPLWVAYPFDPTAASVQPETPARIARVQAGAGGGYYIGLQLYLPLRDGAREAGNERRRSTRFSFALPIFVRPSGSLWPEESMTQNVSNYGVRFETARAYRVGEMVLAKIPWGEWSKAGEIFGRVVRVEPPTEVPEDAPGDAERPAGYCAPLSSVAVEWLNAGQKPNGDTAKLSRINRS
ncbi:MAG TPA: PilZ domain-containing protein [Candidatus Aquilonibacter sp.]|nr:PilZ domain-containing protein [Candidatus Aquilonibacter sp.]